LIIPSNIVDNWSNERESSAINAKIFDTESTVSLELWTLSYQWAKSTKNVVYLHNDASKQYCIRARDLQSITSVDLNKYINKKRTTFNQFKNHLIFSVWK